MSDLLKNFSELEKMANNILQKRNQKVQEESKKVQQKQISKIIRKTHKVKKDALESQVFCHDGPFLVVVLLELGTFYSISKKMDIATIVDLEQIPKEVIQSLLNNIIKKRNNPELRMKMTITETFLGYIYRQDLTESVQAFNLKTDMNVDNKIFEIIEAHNLKR